MSPRTILAVEDSADHAMLIEMALRRGVVDCDVKIALSGAAAMDYLEAPPNSATCPRPDLIILDMWLGDWTGLDLLDWLAGKPELSKIPVLMLTGSGHPDLEAQALALGAVRFLVKPLDFRSLAGIIAEFLPHSAAVGATDRRKGA